MPVEKSFADEAHSACGGCSSSAPRRAPWRRLGSASEAWSKAQQLGSRGTRHKEDIRLASVRAWTYRAAVDLRRLDAREECAIETWIAGKACPIALLTIDDRFNLLAVSHVPSYHVPLRDWEPTTESDSGQRLEPNYGIRDVVCHFTEGLSVSSLTVSEYARGAVFGLAAVSIWSGWIVAARLGLKTSLTPWDITAIRFGVAGLIVLPYLLRKGLAIDRLGWIGLAAILLGGGAPMVLVANAGLLYAPAAHAGALFPGVMPLQVAILAALVIREPFTGAKRIGFSLILAGALGMVWGSGGTIGSQQNIGHALFLAAGFLWACYTVAMRKARLEGLHAAAIAAVGALLTYVPAYAFLTGASLIHAPWRDVALQGVVQGVLTAVISLLLYGRAVSILGASSGAALAALCPAMTALFAIPVLGEWPTMVDWVAIILISVGVYFVSGGPLRMRQAKSSE